MSPARPDQLSELSSVIGELRNFAAQQTVTNAHMLEELKKIADRMSGFGEIGATFVEYRKTLHERFGKIHGQISQIDERADKHEEKIDRLEHLMDNFQGQWRTVVAIAWVVGTVLSSLLSAYGGSILRSLVHP